MSLPPDQKQPLVEPSPEPAAQPDTTARTLHLRIRQQEILAELGVLALQGVAFDELLGQTTRLTAEGLEAEFCKVMEYLPGENSFLVRAGVGWGANVIGKAKVGADLESPAGFALRTGKPVISNHLENEERFRTPELLIRFGIRRAMNVILQGEGSPFGVLEADATPARRATSWKPTLRSCKARPIYWGWPLSVSGTSAAFRPPSNGRRSCSKKSIIA